MTREGDVLMSSGSEFHAKEPVAEIERFPNIHELVA